MWHRVRCSRRASPRERLTADLPRPQVFEEGADDEDEQGDAAHDIEQTDGGEEHEGPIEMEAGIEYHFRTSFLRSQLQ